MINSDELMWGTGNSPVHSQGASPQSDWLRWEGQQQLTPSATGNDFDRRFVEDFSLLAEHRLTHFRFTIDWARIEPFQGQIDREALEMTHQQLHAAVDAGLHVWLTLHDGSLPGWFSEDTEGFRTTDGPSLHWSRHVDRMAELFDEFATAWMPVMDPIGWALESHYLGRRPPGRTSISDCHDAIEGIVDATFEAHRLLASGPKPVVGSFALPHIHTSDDVAVASGKHWEQTIWRSWSGAITEGVLEWPWKAAIDRPDMADAFDAIGIAIAAPLLVDATASITVWPTDATRRDGGGWAPTAERFDETLYRAGEMLPNKDLLITGFGLNDGDDAWRSELFEGWLDAILGARGDGVRIRGVFLEPAIDGYCEAAGAFVDSGVFTRTREPKPSLRWITAQQ